MLALLSPSLSLPPLNVHFCLILEALWMPTLWGSLEPFPPPQSTQQVWSTYLLRALVMAYIQAITHGIYMTYRKLVIDWTFVFPENSHVES